MKKALRNYSFIKGKLAEAIVERLFMTVGFDVYPYGIEKKLPPVLLRLHRKSPRRLFQRLDNDPDFQIVREAGGGFSQSVEVKFRSSGKIETKDLTGYDTETLFVLVNPSGLYALHAKELARFGETVDFTACAKLAHHRSLPLTRHERAVVHAFTPLVAATLGQCLPEKALENMVSHSKRKKYIAAFNRASAGRS